MHKRTFVLSILLLTSFGLHAASSSNEDKKDEIVKQETLDENKEQTGLPQIEIVEDDDNNDDEDASFSITEWFKERTKTQLGGIFAGLGAGIYGIYKLITVAMGNDEDEVQQEEVKPLVKRDHEILVAFSDAMIADVEHLKAGEEVAPSTELFDFSDMEDERFMKEGEIVKRTFVYLYNECKESPEKVEALEGFTTTLKQDIVEMPVTA